MATRAGQALGEWRWLTWADRFDQAVPELPWGSPFGSNRTLRNILIDCVFVAVGLGLSLTSAESVVHGTDGFPLWLRVLDVLLGAGGYTLVFWRRRLPLIFAAYVILGSTFCTTLSGLTAVAVFTVAVHRRWPTALLTMLASVLAVWPYLSIYDVGSDVTLLVLAAFLTFACAAWGMFIRARRELVSTLRERAEQAEAGRAELADRARLAERQRIAREMHDVLAHRLSLLSVHAGALEFRPDAPPAEIAHAAAVIRSTSHEALNELRSVVRLLREDSDQDAPPQPTIQDLPALLAEARAGGTRVQAAISVHDVPVTVGRAVYRIVQEGLTNSRKHAPGSAVTVEVAGSAGAGVTVRIDSPLSVNPSVVAPGSGTGLIGLRERAELAGGSLGHRVTADGHFELQSWLPWQARS